jgi:2-polyprenyl-3-methyl-5-hydroxy-6-metoxy-1,4-benzoquinol methylase
LVQGLVYRSALIYEVSMIAAYGRYYGERYQAIADLIPAGATVVDVCCGPGILYQRYLRQKRVTYTGLDINEKFVRKVMLRGLRSGS